MHTRIHAYTHTHTYLTFVEYGRSTAPVQHLRIHTQWKVLGAGILPVYSRLCVYIYVCVRVCLYVDVCIFVSVLVRVCVCVLERHTHKQTQRERHTQRQTDRHIDRQNIHTR